MAPASPLLPLSEVDPAHLDGLWAGPIVLAHMCWPGAQRAQQHAIATWAASMMAVLESEELATETTLGMAEALGRVAAQLGVSEAEVMKMPNAREFMQAVGGLPGKVRADIDAALFLRSGGLATVATAPGLDQVNAYVAHAVGGGAALAGLVLLTVARLAKHHPEVGPASQKRAVEVVWATTTQRGSRSMIDDWKRWRRVLPLWAALVCRASAAGNKDALRATMDDALSPAGVRSLLSHAAWFRQFARAHQAPGAARPLLLPSEVDPLPGGFPPTLPDIRPLDGQALAAARRHKRGR